MALVMVQGHVSDLLLSPEVRASPLYQFQLQFHGSTAPGFLFASGFVAGLPRAPLSFRAGLRRARRLLFVLAVGYWLHLPYFSLVKTLEQSSPAERAAFLASNALQVIAVTQLLVLAIQALARRAWMYVTGGLAVVLLLAGPAVWASGIGARLPPWLGAYVDERSGSAFPVFPFAVFVLAGSLAGAWIGRQPVALRPRRTSLAGGIVLLAGALWSLATPSGVLFWKISPAYVLVRLGALLLLLRLMEAATRRPNVFTRALGLIGRETLLVYVLHLILLYGGVAFGPSPVLAFAGRLGLLPAFAVLLALLPVLLLASFVWHRAKMRAPHEARLGLVFLSLWFGFAFLIRPW
jgi:hypothetical protein